MRWCCMSVAYCLWHSCSAPELWHGRHAGTERILYLLHGCCDRAVIEGWDHTSVAQDYIRPHTLQLQRAHRPQRMGFCRHGRQQLLPLSSCGE
jgi:hypothetical protein